MSNTQHEAEQRAYDYQKLLEEEVKRMDAGEPRQHPGIPDPRFELQAMREMFVFLAQHGPQHEQW